MFKRMLKKIVAVAAVATTITLAVGSYGAVTGNAGFVAKAEGRPGSDVVVHVSGSSSSSDGKYYLFADEVYQDGTTGRIVASTEAGKNATFTFPLEHYTANSNLSKKFLVAAKSGVSYVQVSDEHYITNPEAIATKTVARNDHGIKGILPNDTNAAVFNDLGISQMVYNLYMGDIVVDPANVNVETIPFEYNGKAYLFNAAALAQYDAFVQWCSMNNYQLTMTILNNKTAAGADLIHPLSRDSHVCPGYAMNTKEDEGTQHLKAITGN